MVKLIEVSASPKQLSKLRNGRKVRIRPAVEGKGICLMVSPEKYDIISRTFSRNKGMDIALTPEEIVANQSASGEMEGRGIFGKQFDRGLKKLIGKKAVRGLYGEAAKYLPLAQAGLTAGLTAAGTALGVAQPELLPWIAPGVAGLSQLGSDYLANPSAYNSNVGGSRAKLASSLAGRMIQDKALGALNKQLGTNMGSLDRASITSALTNKALAQLNAEAIAKKQAPSLDAYYGNMFDGIEGNGLYAGRGLGLGLKQRRCGGSVGINAGMVSPMPPALRSQPFSANFQFQHTLPPAFQKFSKGSGLQL